MVFLRPTDGQWVFFGVELICRRLYNGLDICSGGGGGGRYELDGGVTIADTVWSVAQRGDEDVGDGGKRLIILRIESVARSRV